jgi:ABC-2 type transport system permease protein
VRAKKYLYNLVSSLKSVAEYRFNLLASIFTSVVYFGANIALWTAITANGGDYAGFTGTDMIWYYIWNFVMDFIFIERIRGEMTYEIHNGQISNFIIKPWSYFWYRYTKSIGRAVLQIIFFFVATVILFRIRFDGFDIRLLLFLVSMIIAHVISFLIAYLQGLLAFWFEQTHGFVEIYNAFFFLLSGAFFPLRFWGPKMYSVLRLLPFQVEVNAPLTFLISKNYNVLETFGIQLFWLAIFATLAVWVYKKGINKLEAVGI